jgi:tetratricopeptide (TPR) repeat protein
MYLPLIGIVALVVIAASRLFERATLPRWAPGLVTAILVTGLGATTFARNRDYDSPLRLAEATLRTWPTDVARGTVGSELGRLHRDDEAIPLLRLASRTDARSRYNLGVELYNVKRFDEALHELQTYAAENPTQDLVPSAHKISGDIYNLKADWRRAIGEYQLVLSMNPHDAEAKHRMVTAINRQALEYIDAGRYREAIPLFARASELDPTDFGAHRNLAAAYLDSQNPVAAEAEARKAIGIAPLDAGSYDLLGRALAIQGKRTEALAQFGEAIKLAPDEAEFRDDLRRVEALEH